MWLPWSGSFTSFMWYMSKRLAFNLYFTWFSSSSCRCSVVLPRMSRCCYRCCISFPSPTFFTGVYWSSYSEFCTFIGANDWYRSSFTSVLYQTWSEVDQASLSSPSLAITCGLPFSALFWWQPCLSISPVASWPWGGIEHRLLWLISFFFISYHTCSYMFILSIFLFLSCPYHTPCPVTLYSATAVTTWQVLGLGTCWIYSSVLQHMCESFVLIAILDNLALLSTHVPLHYCNWDFALLRPWEPVRSLVVIYLDAYE